MDPARRLAPVLAAIVAAGVGFAQDKKVQRPQPFEEIARSAAVARDQNRLADAVGLYRRGLKVKPSWDEGWWYLGTLLYSQDEYGEARNAMRRLTALEPGLGSAFAILGLCEFQLRDYEPALTHLNRALALGMKDIPQQMSRVVLYHSAILLSRFGEYEKARVILTSFCHDQASPQIIEAVGIASLFKPLLPAEAPPQDRDLIVMTGTAVCTAESRVPAQAEPLFEQLVAKYPGVPNVHYLYACSRLVRDPETGLRELLKELELNPNHVPSLGLLAGEYLKRGEPKTALSYAQRAAVLAPGSSLAHATLGRALVETDQLDKGIAELEVAVRLGPENPQTHWVLGSAYAKAGRQDLAGRELQESARLRQLQQSPEPRQ